MAYFEQRKTKAGITRVRAQVRMSGYPTVDATFTKKREAQAWAAKVETEMRAGKYDHNAIANHKFMSDAIDKYIDEVLPVKSTKQRYISQQLSQLIWWKVKIGGYLLAHVTPGVISAELSSMRKTKSAGTANRYLAALSHLFTKICKDWSWLQENPIHKIEKMKEPRGRVRFLSPSEREKLFKTCQESQCVDLFPIVLVAISTGARKAEILDLGWENYDTQRHQIAVLETKNDERRTLYLRGRAMEVFWALYEKAGKPEAGRIFPHDIDKYFREAVRAAGIKDFRFHDLRHTCASYLAMNGTSLVAIAELLGHKTLNMVKRYAHLSESHTAAQIEEMNKLFN